MKGAENLSLTQEMVGIPKMQNSVLCCITSTSLLLMGLGEEHSKAEGKGK